MGAEHTDNHNTNPDPFLLTDSKVMTGQGKAVVLAVGAHTLLARIRGKKEYQVNQSETHLDHKLDTIAKKIG
jgi:magnesium-transporting ATPase (P-type)